MVNVSVTQLFWRCLVSLEWTRSCGACRPLPAASSPEPSASCHTGSSVSAWDNEGQTNQVDPQHNELHAANPSRNPYIALHSYITDLRQEMRESLVQIKLLLRRASLQEECSQCSLDEELARQLESDSPWRGPWPLPDQSGWSSARKRKGRTSGKGSSQCEARVAQHTNTPARSLKACTAVVIHMTHSRATWRASLIHTQAASSLPNRAQLQLSKQALTAASQ